VESYLGNVTVESQVNLILTDSGVNLSALVAQTNTNTSEITSLESNVSTLQTDVSTNTSDIGTLQTNVTTLQGQVSTNTSNIGTLQTNVTTLQGQIVNKVDSSLLGAGNGVATLNTFGYLPRTQMPQPLLSSARYTTAPTVAVTNGSGSGVYNAWVQDSFGETWLQSDKSTIKVPYTGIYNVIVGPT